MHLLCAGDGERCVFCRDGPETIEFGAAQLGSGRSFATTAAADRVGVKRHRVITRADQEMFRQISHRCHNFL
jgi:hypothetical protein